MEALPAAYWDFLCCGPYMVRGCFYQQRCIFSSKDTKGFSRIKTVSAVWAFEFLVVRDQLMSRVIVLGQSSAGSEAALVQWTRED